MRNARPASKPRPASLVFLVFVNLSFGGLMLCCCVSWDAIYNVAFGAMEPDGPRGGMRYREAFLAAHVPGYLPVQVVNVMAEVGLGVAAVAAGVGLLGRRRWAYHLTWGYLLLDVVRLGLMAAYGFTYFPSAVRAWEVQGYMEAHPESKSGPSEHLLSMSVQGAVHDSCLRLSPVLLLIPILVFVWLGPMRRLFRHGVATARPLTDSRDEDQRSGADPRDAVR